MTIVNQRPGCVEMPWVRFLLGERAGEVVDDPERTLVVPHSLVLCDQLDRMAPDTLARVGELGTVGLFHISQEWYQDPLDAYAAFGFVWRNHHHSGLRHRPVLQLPLPPAALDEVTAEPLPVALKPVTGRRHTWSFMGQLKTTRVAMLEAFRRIDGGYEHRSGSAVDHQTAQLQAGSYLDVLGDSIFVPCAMGNAHLESFRVYEALEVGAIPLVERRPWLDYFGALLGDHPLPTVRSWSEAPGLVNGLLGDEARLEALQERLVTWWTAKKQALARAARDDVDACFTATPRARQERREALARVPSVNRGRLEMLRHHNLRALHQRARVTVARLRRHGSVRQVNAGAR